jgi:DNA-directed RNA polymerase specialized sigma24 family protein
MRGDTASSGAGRQFPQTRWTLILSTRDRPETRRAALDELLSAYWQPLYCFARRKGLDVESAQDAVQGFLAHLLERDFLDKLDPSKGRLRSYLRTGLSNYLINQHAHAAAQKRGGGATMIPLDFDAAERAIDGAAATPETAYDHAWAIHVMERALEQLRREFEDGHRRGPFAVVREFFQPGAMPAYAAVAAEHGMTVPQLKSFLHRARLRFRELVRQEVADTVSDAAEIDTEIGDLMRALSA